VQEVAAMRAVSAGARDQADDLGLAAAKVDFAFPRITRKDPCVSEEGGGDEVMAAAGAVDEGESYRLSGAQMNRLRRESVTPYQDRLPGRLGGCGAA